MERSLGFYRYDKFPCPFLDVAFVEIYRAGRGLYDLVKHPGAGIPITGAELQYPLALGNLVPFTMAENLRQAEFRGWQRTKGSVNHEVRQVCLGFEKRLRAEYPWWSLLSRADMTPAYVFARGKELVPLAGSIVGA